MPSRESHQQQIARIGGLTRAATNPDPSETGRRGQRGLMARFLAKVPATITDPIEREKRAGLLLKAHMSGLARRSALKRAKPRRAA